MKNRIVFGISLAGGLIFAIVLAAAQAPAPPPPTLSTALRQALEMRDRAVAKVERTEEYQELLAARAHVATIQALMDAASKAPKPEPPSEGGP